jgi:predicted alpha/beta hydrolase
MAASVINVQHINIPATDGYELGATLYQSDIGNANGKIILINSAMAVKRAFYDKYARFFSDEGFSVITFDYRGIGDSRPPSLKGFNATARDWAEKDIAGAIDWVAKQFPSARLLVVGHSMGGQVLGLLPNHQRIAAALTVAAQSGYWGLWDPPRRRYFMLFFWYVMLPTLTGLFSYFPGRRFGMGEDVPAGVALEWARWGRNPNYLVEHDGVRERYKAFSAPILAYSFSDDTYAPKRTVEGLLSFYSQARTAHRHIAPRELSVPAIGHFGFFKEQFKSSLWAETLQWLQRQ